MQSQLSDLVAREAALRAQLSTQTAMALKLSAAFRTTPEFWLNAQKAVDLWAARHKLRRLPKPLVPAVRSVA